MKDKRRKPCECTADYTGALAEPILDECCVDSEYAKKFLLLRDLFNIQDGPDAGWQLALALARKHVPGFQIESVPLQPTRGRKQKPLTTEELAIFAEQLTKLGNEKAAAEATARILKLPRKEAGTLRQRYRRHSPTKRFSGELSNLP